MQSSGDSCLTSNNCDPGKLCVNLHNTNPVCIPDICTYSTTLHVHGIHVNILKVRKKKSKRRRPTVYGKTVVLLYNVYMYVSCLCMHIVTGIKTFFNTNFFSFQSYLHYIRVPVSRLFTVVRPFLTLICL